VLDWADWLYKPAQFEVYKVYKEKVWDCRPGERTLVRTEPGDGSYQHQEIHYHDLPFK